MKEKISKNIQLLDKKLQERILAFREFEASYINAKLIGDKKKVLNIGCLWGRDYYFLKCLGKEVYNFDLGDQKLPNMNIGDISKRTKFKHKEFDAILIGEVIEHLFEDVNALKEIRPSALREVQVQIPNVNWDDVGGLDELKEELMMLQWLDGNSSRFPVVDFWASIMGPQVACVLRNLEFGLSDGLGCGHGLFCTIEVKKQ